MNEQLIPARSRGQRSAVLAHITDVMPTLLAVASGDTASVPANLDGHNLWPQLLGHVGVPSEDTPDPRTEVLYNIDPIGMLHQATVPDPKCSVDFGSVCTAAFANAALRVGSWKLVWCRDPGGPHHGSPPSAAGQDDGDHFWLYDVDADVSERHDRSADRPGIAESLRRRLLELWGEMVPPIRGTEATERDVANAQPRQLTSEGAMVIDWPMDLRHVATI